MSSDLNLTQLFLASSSLRERFARLRQGDRSVYLPPGAPSALPILWATAFADLGRSMLVLVPRPEETTPIAETIGLYSSETSRIVEWPAYDFLPYERGTIQMETAAARLRVLEMLRQARDHNRPVLVVASVKALTEPTLSREDFEAHRLELSIGQSLNLVSTTRHIAAMGYTAQPLVESPGTFSRRGDILDIWTPAHPLPVRIELFGDEVDSVRTFDPESQRSDANLHSVTITPPIELPLWECESALQAVKQLELSALRPEVRSEWEQMLLELDAGNLRPTYAGLAPYFPDGMHTLFDHLPEDCVVATAGKDRLQLVADSLHSQAEEIRAGLEDSGEIPKSVQRPYFLWNELEPRLDSCTQLLANEDEGGHPLVAGVIGFSGNVDRLLTRLKIWIEEDRRIVLVTRQAERTRHLLMEHDIPVAAIKGFTEPPPGAVTIRNGTVQEGWLSDELNAVLLGDGELWGYVDPRRRSAPRRHTRQTFSADLETGGYVVHIDHGIARYIGNTTRGVPGAEREYLILEYASGDVLYVPADQVDRISPYIGAGGTPALSRLGTADWARTKRRVKKAAEDLAQELLRLYAARQLAKGYGYPPDGPLQHEFEDTFPYAETEDQLSAIHEVKDDMEAPRPMDRLICGDVGYGKTEVAIRAAFKAVNDSKQVAVLVPTTVLALQHYETFRHRLSAFPVRVEMLSRLRPRKERQEVIEGIKSGSVDIVIGTHMMLGKQIEFKDLGLLVVDEEQRFGVKHKEQLKQKRTEVDVLTLTATPIPRTLQMALAGARDLSIIETPPEDRLPIKTYVTSRSDTLIRETVLREIDRGGQVYFVYNRIHDIARVARELSRIVPEARVAIGHGQMHPDELERVMLSFVEDKHDLLLCTTIIESGLDIPNVNTLLIDDAANFGLAQLYQLRGRIGRSARRAYAYLMYRGGGVMNEDAQKRLDAIAEASELGAGFRIAMKDLEIRGAGNFLGPEQSGHVAAVGLDLYTQLLERAVNEARTGVSQPEPPGVTIDLPLKASLPEEYIPDKSSRIRMYRRIANAATEREVKLFEDELRDRFGTLPEAAKNLVRIIELKMLARDADVTSISVVEGDVVLRITRPVHSKPPGWKGQLRIVPGQIRFRFRGSQDRWMSDLRSLLIELGDEESEANAATRAAAASGELSGSRSV